MNVETTLRELHLEKKRLDSAIAALEARLKTDRAGSGKPAKNRRGRKAMSAAERAEVSKRMTLYWQSRRQTSNHSESEPGRTPSQSSS
ncbi:MAG: hypothetical protein JOZ32_01505 [Bryobacterales bacterium]|nr:hypothetical protein [Bryobacterales bacterium]